LSIPSPAGGAFHPHLRSGDPGLFVDRACSPSSWGKLPMHLAGHPPKRSRTSAPWTGVSACARKDGPWTAVGSKTRSNQQSGVLGAATVRQCLLSAPGCSSTFPARRVLDGSRPISCEGFNKRGGHSPFPRDRLSNGGTADSRPIAYILGPYSAAFSLKRCGRCLSSPSGVLPLQN
jgi:hypothetical protein